MLIELKHFEGQKEKPWYVIMNDDDRFNIEKFASEQDAHEFYQTIKNTCLPGKSKPASKENDTPKFSEYADHYLSTYVKVVCKLQTWKHYKRIIEGYLIPAWTSKTLDQISRTGIKNVLLNLQEKGLSPSTVGNIRAVISGIFSYACEEELIAVNPASRLGKFIKKTDKRKNGTSLQNEQVARFLKAACKSFSDYYPLFVCAFSTGMRLGEILALAWEDIDFDKHNIRVERSYSHGIVSTTKSGKIRFVDMSKHLCEILLRHRDDVLTKRGGIFPEADLSLNGDSVSSIHLVFPNKNGGLMDGANLKNRIFYKVIEAAGLPHFRFHDIRHTFASMLLNQGESLHYVKAQMGHSSIQTTVDIYGHISPSGNKNAVNKLESCIKE